MRTGRCRCTSREASSTEGAGSFEAREVEGDVDRETAEAILARGHGLAAVLAPTTHTELHQRFGNLEELTIWGHTDNLRRCYPIDRSSTGWTLELDRTAFPGGSVEFEIEVESEDLEGVKPGLAKLLEKAEIEWIAQTRTKSERLRSYLAEH